jgi:gluconate kinase
MEKRKEHFMKAGLLSSQFAALEEPKGVLTVDISQEPLKIVNSIEHELQKWGG